MSDFGSAFSRCGRLGIIFVYCWLSGQNWSCCYCCVSNFGSKTTTKSNVYYNHTQTSTFPTTTSTALPTTTLTTESAAASTTVSTTDPSSFKPQIQTTANVHLSSGAFSNKSDSQANMLIIIIPSVALIILLIVGAILIQK